MTPTETAAKPTPSVRFTPSVIGSESVASSIAHGETETATGLPQLDTATFANQIFWLIVTMLVLYWVVAKIALPRIGAVLSDRQGAVTGDLMAAEEFKLKAKEAEAAYDKALADARAEAGKIVAANRAEIQKELDAAIAHADAEISARAAESEKRIREIRAVVPVPLVLHGASGVPDDDIRAIDDWTL